MNGFSDTVGALTLLGGDITTGAGTLTMNNNLTATYRGVGNSARIVGKLGLGAATRTFTVTNTPGLGSADLAVVAEVSGTGGIIKTGDGLMTMSASNSFTGALTVNDGDVDLQNDFAAGSPAGGVIVNGDATLGLFGDIDVGTEALTLNSTAVAGAFTSRINSNSWAGPITLTIDSAIKVSSGHYLNLLGSISGPGGVIKLDAGTLIYSGPDANTYAGLTTVNAGTLVLGKSIENIALTGNLVIGDGLGGANADVVRLQTTFQLPTNTAVIVNSSGRFDCNGNWRGLRIAGGFRARHFGRRRHHGRFGQYLPFGFRNDQRARAASPKGGSGTMNLTRQQFLHPNDRNSRRAPVG